MSSRARPKVVIHSWSEVPAFASEAEEAEFWATHALGDELLDQMDETPEGLLPPARPRTRPIAVRFDESTVRRIKALAARRHKGYQTLLKEFVAERLYEEEKREGIL
jgi:predicted DNA binding CopG/RHH family protein